MLLSTQSRLLPLMKKVPFVTIYLKSRDLVFFGHCSCFVGELVESLSDSKEDMESVLKVCRPGRISNMFTSLREELQDIGFELDDDF